MAVVVRMPAAIAGAAEASLQSWHVAVGDRVEAGQTIAEIETEKAVFEHEADASGVVARLLVEPGVPVAVGAPIAIIADSGESVEQAIAASSASAEEAAASDGDASAAEDSPASTPPVVDRETPGRVFASPLVRRLAKERGLDLATVAGSGPDGRIVRRDLDALAGAAAPAGQASASAGDDVGYVDTPHTPLRRAIARRLTESVTRIPQFVVTAECRVDRLVALRAEANEDRTTPVSVNDLVVKAVAGALIEVPEANAIWTDDAVRRFVHADIGVAIAIDGGLVTPVVRGAEGMPLGELSTRLRDLAERARAGRLRQSELDGGSFAVSNLGMHGAQEFTAIVNPPHAGILAIGAAARRAVVADDGAIEAATIMTLNLTADHRVLDGALAARLLAAIVRRLEHPIGMLV